MREGASTLANPRWVWKAGFRALKLRMAYGPSALDDIDRSSARERAQILRKIERLEHGSHGNIKRLHKAEAMFRLRMGDYRVFLDVEGSAIVIRRIVDRKDVYD